MDKTSAERPLVKKGSDKIFKLPSEKQSDDEYRAALKSSGSHATTQELEQEEEVAFDLPPPMKPIQDAQSLIGNGPTVSAVVEQSPCKRVSIYAHFIRSQKKVYCFILYV